MSDDPDHPFLGVLLRRSQRLRRAESAGSRRVLATYWTDEERCPFAFCAEGLLIDPAGEARYVPFAEIEVSGYHDLELLERSKRALETGEILEEVLTIRLRSGEAIALPLNRREDGMSERLSIGRLVEKGVRLHRPKEPRASN